MPGAMASNQAWFALTKQTALNSPAGPPTYKAPYSGGSRVKGTKTHGQYAETDSQLDEGVDFVQSLGAAGAPQAYLRDSYGHFLLEAALGARATTGTVNFVHTLTPSTLSYWTIHQMLGGQVFEVAQDNLINQMTISGAVDAGYTIALDAQGRKNNPLTADPAGAVLLASDPVYNWNDTTVTLSGGATAAVRSLELTYDNGVQLLRGADGGVPFDVYQGRRSVTAGFDMYFQNLTEYNQFYYGTASPAANAPQSTAVRVTDLAFNLSHGTNNAITLSLPRIQIEEFPVDPATSADPIIVAVRARAQRGGTPVLTATVKNQVA